MKTTVRFRCVWEWCVCQCLLCVCHAINIMLCWSGATRRWLNKLRSCLLRVRWPSLPLCSQIYAWWGFLHHACPSIVLLRFMRCCVCFLNDVSSANETHVIVFQCQKFLNGDSTERFNSSQFACDISVGHWCGKVTFKSKSGETLSCAAHVDDIGSSLTCDIFPSSLSENMLHLCSVPFRESV